MQKHASSLWSLPTRSVWHLASVEEGVGATAGDNEGLGASGAGVLKGSLCHPWRLLGKQGRCRPFAEGVHKLQV